MRHFEEIKHFFLLIFACSIALSIKRCIRAEREKMCQMGFVLKILDMNGNFSEIHTFHS